MDERCAQAVRQRRRALARTDLRLRYQLRDLAQLISPAKGVRACGRQTVWVKRAGENVQQAGVELVIRAIGKELRAHFTGLVKCKNPWQCAVCALALQIERGKLIQQLNEKHVAAGGSFDMGTFTLPHNQGDPLKPMRRKVSDAWRRVISGAPWLRQKESLGIIGVVRAHEITTGVHGFHPHIHVAFYYSGQVSDAQRDRFRDFLFERWRDAITRPDKNGRRWRAPSRENGVKLEPLRKTDYLTKMGLARELVMSTTKEGRDGHQTPFQLLRDTLQTDDVDRKNAGLRVWREWSRDMRGARQLTTSRGLFTRYGLPELSDRQLFLEERGPLGAETVVVWFSAEEWAEIVRRGPALRVQLLAVVTVPEAQRAEYILSVLDRSAGLPPLPF